MKRVTQHPCIGWDTDDLGETTTKQFGPPIPRTVQEFAPGGSTEGGTDTDDTVRSRATLYFPGRRIATTSHDEWIIDGRRWEQDGDGDVWALGTVVTVTRRTG